MDRKNSKKHWNKIGTEKRIGTAIALFSLKSKKQRDYGVGDFGSLYEFIDLCNEYNLNIIQLLPINETSPHDNSPFGSISAFAVNPIYLDIKKLIEAEGFLINEHELSRLNSIEEFTEHVVSYNIARSAKHKIALNCFESFNKNASEERKEAFKQFKKKNKWLKAYSLFKVLKDENEWRAIYDWEKTLQTYSEQLYKKEEKRRKNQIDFQKYIQWNLFIQLKEIHKYSLSKNILIKGDIPLLVSNESADAWENPKYFDSTKKVGAPPDYYSEEGQDWGLPMYNWESHHAENFKWWKKRLSYAENFFDLYRIDHVLGLFRVWAIPQRKKATEGDFIPKDESKWETQGKELLKMMLSSTDMLPIAEDLGLVPNIVRETLDRLGIPGYKLMILEHRIPPQVFSEISLLATSTHDSPTLVGMWNNMSNEDKQQLIYTLSIPITAEPYNAHIHYHLLYKLIDVPTRFVILPLQDILGHIPGFIGDKPDNDRVNTPGTIGIHNWSYRLPDLQNNLIQQKLYEFRNIVNETANKQKNYAEEINKTEKIVNIAEIRKIGMLKINESVKIKSKYGGMARIISNENIIDKYFVQDKDGLYYAAILKDDITENSKITFFWRKSPNKQQWEGKDYKLKI